MADSIKLETLMQAASLGSLEAAARFFEELLEVELYVPHRFQEQPLSDAPEYPNPFFNLLGVQADGRAVIPVFTSQDCLDDWAGMPLTVEKLSGMDLMNKVPEEWWVVLNPGQNLEKELSPWEIDQLRGRNIAAIIAELEDVEEQTPMSFVALPEDSEKELKTLLLDLVKELPSIEKIYLAQNVQLDVEVEGDDSRKVEDEAPRLLIGLECGNLSAEERGSIRDKILTSIAKLFIGREEPQIYINGGSDMMFGLFKQLAPLYKREEKRSFFSRCFKFFNNKFYDA